MPTSIDQPIRAKFWRRVFAFVIDALLIGIVISLIGILVFASTNGRARVSDQTVSVGATTCTTPAANLTEIGLPADFQITHSFLCTKTLLGFTKDRFFKIEERTKKDWGTFTRTVSIPAGIDGKPISAAYYVGFDFYLLFFYLLLSEWYFGRTLGKNIFDVRLQSLDGGSVGFFQAVKRTLIRLLSIIIPWLLLDGKLAEEQYFQFTVLGIAVAVAIAQIINFILATRRSDLPWHDRWAKTQVIRGR